MTHDPIDAAKQRNLGQLLLRSARLFDAMAFARWSAGHPTIRRAHLQLMPHLDLEGTRITELARRAEITKQAVGQLVSDMEASGYVERLPDPTDQRAKMVVLTQRGRQAVLEGLAVFEELREELEAETGGGTMEALLDGLEKVSRGLDALVARDRDAPR
ncbi:MAG: MarR family transcriptional regulator [Polyangiales bacterium]|jgi:DNA-binding MarR family transcriptional regulator